jgi:hypothetical protein
MRVAAHKLTAKSTRRPQMLSATRRIVAHDVFQRRVAAKMK